MVNPTLAKIGLKIINKAGYYITPIKSLDYSESDFKIIKYVDPFTLIDHPKLKSLLDGVEYVIKNHIEGCFVECGVWKGGAIMAIIKKLQDLDINNRDVFLFDTFSGMSKPTEHDISQIGYNAVENYDSKIKNNHSNVSLDDVKNNVYKTDYPKSRIHFLKGEVEATLPKTSFDKIALLRLDTDWYESTKAELEYLFPKLSKGGILIIDDYGGWLGARKATTEYIEKNRIKIYLNRIHPTGSRIGIKM